MTIERITETLETLGLKDKYLQNFKDNEIDDEVVQDCLDDPQLITNLNAIIPLQGHLIKFVKLFKSKLATPQNSNGPANESNSGLITAIVHTDTNSQKNSLEHTTLPNGEINHEQSKNGKDAPKQEVLIDSSEPHPVQIMDFEESKKYGAPSKVVFHKNLMEQILSKAKSKKVGVLAIAGPSRKGKSFFLNFVLRYLNGLKTNDTNWMGWHQSSRLEGFSWKNCVERVTTGIWMWSEPFTIKSKNEEFDLLVMDTQGVFDEHTTQREWSILVGLGLLTSSCLIFNIMSDLQEDYLQVFENFLSFGLMALDKQDSRTPFQKLVFLIRDWNIPGEFPYGSSGGKKFIDQKLDTKSHHKESHKRVREQLRQCFEDISCFLLPHPGQVVLDLNFDGSATKIQSFAAEIEKCILELLNPLKFPLKKINGNFLSSQDIVSTFEMFSELFNSDELPNPESVFDILAKNCNAVVTKKCLDAFIRELHSHLEKRPFLLHEELMKIKTPAEQCCLDMFEKSRKMGDDKILQNARVNLEEEIDETFNIIEERNRANLERAVNNALDIGVTEYKDLMLEGLHGGFLSVGAFDKLSNESEGKATDCFILSCGIRDCSLLPDAEEKLCEFLNTRKQEFEKENAMKRLQAESELDLSVQNIVKDYTEKVVSRTQGTVVSEEQLVKINEAEKNKAISEFDELDAHQDLREMGEVHLMKRLANEFQQIRASVLMFNEKTQAEATNLTVDAAQKYQDEVKSKMTIDKNDFLKLLEETKVSAKKMVIKSFPVNDEDLFDKFLHKLEDEIEKHDMELKEVFLRCEKEFKLTVQDAKDSALKKYSTAMQDTIQECDQAHVEPEILENAHGKWKSLAIESLKNSFDEVYQHYEGVDGNILDDFLIELEKSADDQYSSLKEQNVLRMDNAAAKGSLALNDIKEAYVNRMKEAIEIATNEEQLKDIFNQASTESHEKLQQDLQDLLPSLPDHKQQLLKALTSYIATEFEGTQEVFRMKMEEDEYTVKSALLEAKVFYNEEMVKHFESKDWLEEKELKKLHVDIVEGAVERGKNEIELLPGQEKQLREVLNISYNKYYEMNLLRMPIDTYAIGIDLGTTYSCVAVCVKGKVKVIPCDGKTTVPSYVSFNDNHSVHVGDAAKEQTFRRPESTVFDAKRLIGRKFSDKIVQEDLQLLPFHVVGEDDQPKIKIPGHTGTYRPEEISARVLVHMKKMAEDYLKKEVRDAVITVPAYFSDSQRQATKDAAQIAGLNARILNEPTSAAIAYELHRTDDLKRNILIFDLGGGTFDVAVLNMKVGQVTVKAIGGDTHLGGEDFDNEMVKHVISIVKNKRGIDLGRGKSSSDPVEKKQASERFRRIRAVCEKQKRILSTSESCIISIPRIDANFDLEETFTRAEFESLNMALFKKCIDVTDKVIADAKMKKSEIEDIVLIGGSTRIPKIRQLLTDYFDGKALNSQINADEAVAYGAAIQAALEHGKSNEVGKQVSVSDVTPMSLGIRVVTGELSVIVPKNTPVPCTKGYPYYTIRDGQTGMDINIYEGEEPMANDNTELGRFSLNGIPSAPRGKEPVDISMNIDREGILHVEAVCRSTGSSNSIKIEAHKGRMSGEEIESSKTAVVKLNW